MNLVLNILKLNKYCSLECLVMDTDSVNWLMLNSDKTVIRKVNEDLRAVMLCGTVKRPRDVIKGTILF